ncbi:MAG TPA: RimJ/RimL family protein N-acetyltransferase [Micromonosporaceae bacterium]|nr:RimJ/RimL family protein N-acetyltransferase [Micromonosporaceae bacterium]
MFALPLGDGAELRPLEPWQAAEFTSHVEEIRAHLKPWIPFASRVVDEASALVLLQQYADLQARDEGRFYGIWIDGKLSGGTLFRTFNAKSGVCEVGVWLAPGAEGRGLITKAVRHMIDWAIRTRGMSRVEWFSDPLNERSKAVAKRLGMTYEGTHRSDFVINGERHDSEVWAVLAEEWNAPPAA